MSRATATRYDSVGGDVKAAFFAALFVAVIATLAEGAIAWMLTPVVMVLSWYAMARAPLRHSLLVLMFLGFTLENPAEKPAMGEWKSPLYPLGAVMLTHLKEAIGFPLPISCMDIAFLSLGVVVFFRRLTKSPIDRAGAYPIPRPLVKLAQLALVGGIWVYIYGALRGGNTSTALWQLDRVFYLPIMFLLFQEGIRGPQDHLAIGKVVIAAATLRAALAVYVQWTVEVEPDPNTGEAILDYATSHHDSMLFAWAAAILMALLIHRADKRTIWLALGLLPVLAAGMVANQRRMVWVQLILVLGTLYLVTPPNPIKRKLQRLALAMVPFGLAYVAIGWNQTGGIFKPVQTIRSAVDSDVDASTQWRDVENINLLYTFKEHPFLGSGYGHPFKEFIPLPEVAYPLEHYIPHNSILGLWAYCGYFGYTAITLLWSAGVYFAMRGYNASKSPIDKSVALASFGAVLIYALQCYGDMGLGSWTGNFMMAASLAAAGKLAVASGAWSATRTKKAGSKAAASNNAHSAPPPRAASSAS